MAFLGAGTSVPLYPLWNAVIQRLIDAAIERGLSAAAARTCRRMASSQPDAVVELLRNDLGVANYRTALRETFRVRRDPDSGRTWTPTHELVCRCPFKGVVTTNYDPGIVDARMRVRPLASGTGFTSWTDELALDRWRTGDVYGDDVLPVLFAHGHHNQPESIVLATTEYRRAYAGKLAQVLARMVDSEHLVWIGFSFADQRINAILREVAEHSGTRIDPGTEPRHVALLPWDPAGQDDPASLRKIAETSYGSDLVLYPAPNSDHSALQVLLASLTDDQYPPVIPLSSVSSSSASPPPLASDTATPTASANPPALSNGTSEEGIKVHWVHGEEQVRTFTGRTEEMTRMDRWADDQEVRCIGVAAWGGAGKTALVTRWAQQATTTVALRRRGVRAVFGWSFYADPSADHWAEALAEWISIEFGLRPTGDLASAVIAAVCEIPVMLILDGLELLQEGPAAGDYGRLLDGNLRHILTSLCRAKHSSLVVLTSRFPFADIGRFDGTSARMLDVAAFTPEEGAQLLAAASPSVLNDTQRRQLVRRVDGHALAVALLGGLLMRHPHATVDGDLFAELTALGKTESKLARVLSFYAEQLTAAQRYLVAAVSLFVHPITPDQTLKIAGHSVFEGELDDWDAAQVQAAARGPLSGLLTWHANSTVSAHPLVRQAFRPIALGAAAVAVDIGLLVASQQRLADRAEAQAFVEAIELLIDAGEWPSAERLYDARASSQSIWMDLPALGLAQRAANAFVGTEARRRDCESKLTQRVHDRHLYNAGVFAMYLGELDNARDAFKRQIDSQRGNKNERWATQLSIAYQALAKCLIYVGDSRAAVEAARAAVEYAREAGGDRQIRDSMSCAAWAAEISGDTITAERQFVRAEQLLPSDVYPTWRYFSPEVAVRWGEFLARTKRVGPARRLAENTLRFAVGRIYRLDAARCETLLARLDLMAGDFRSADTHLTSALATFRDGDVVIELVDALAVAAENARYAGNLLSADDHIAEILTITAPRGLVPAQVEALNVRARVAADRFAAASDRRQLNVGRDAADAALRLVTGSGSRHLPWHELAALNTHAYLDTVEGRVEPERGERITQLSTRLLPPGLAADPPSDLRN